MLGEIKKSKPFFPANRKELDKKFLESYDANFFQWLTVTNSL